LSQEYTEDKNVTLNRLSSGRRVLEAVLVVIAVFAVFLMAALLSFNQSDPSWSQTSWHGPIHNLGGGVGAWIADTLFFIFGVLAYAIPIIILCLCWAAYRNREQREYFDYFALALRLIGTLALILTSCGLAALNFDDLYNFTSGGVIGSLLSTAMKTWFNSVGATLALLCIWAAGLTLFTGWSWLVIAEKIGAVVLGTTAFVTNRSRRDDHDEYDEHDDEYDDEPPVRVSAPEKSKALPLGAAAASLAASAKPAAAELDDVLFSAPSLTIAGQPENEAVDVIAAAAFVESEQPAELLHQQPAQQMPPLQPQQMPPLQPLHQATVQQQPVEPEMLTIAEPVRPPLYRFEIPEETPVLHAAQPAINTVQPSNTIQSPNTYTARTSVNTAAPVVNTAIDNTAIHDDGPSMGNWAQATESSHGRSSSDFNSPRIDSTAVNSLAATAALATGLAKAGQSSESSNLFMPAFSAFSDGNSQVKKGDGPQLPRPNPVRLPTRRELASYGIKLPSQRLAEQQEKAQAALALKAQENEQLTPQVDDDQAAEQEQAALAQAFAAQQQQRYAETDSNANVDQHNAYEHGSNELSRYEHSHYEHSHYEQNAQVSADDEPISAEEEAELTQLREAFAAREQARYQSDNTSSDNIQSDVNHAASYPQTSSLAHNMREEPAVTAWQQPSQSETAERFDASELQKVIDHEAFNFSPMADLIDDTPVEPLFTLSAIPEDKTPQAAADVSYHAQNTSSNTTAYQQPAEPAKPAMDSLIHPFLMRNDQPLSKPTTPLPSLDLLTSAPAENEPVDMFALEQTAQLIEARLNDYRIKADVVDKLPGPVITRFELDLAPGVKAARISNLSRDLARSLSTVAVRIVEVIPGKPYVGLELPNKHRQTVYLREVLDCPAFKDSPSPLTIVLGKDIAGEPVVADLAKMPHLLVAGTTGSGKSVGVNAMILSMLYKSTPEDVRFIMIDPKMLELSVYEGIPHLLTEVVTDMKDAANALRWCVGEMERRYKLMSALGVRNLAGYNDRVKEAEEMGRPIPDPFWKPGDGMAAEPPMLEKLPYIVVMVDEFADLMMTVGKKVEELIARLAQKARAAGIHLVLATQRPSVDVITGLIKANIPTRIAFTVSSKIDSRTILDQGGAESLLGMGDMLYMAPNSSIPVRVHGAFVRDQEVHAVVQDWKARGRPQYIDSITSGGDDGEGGSQGLEDGEELDPLFDQAVAFVVDKRRASISGVQRQFRIGYNRAARIVEQMEAQSIVSAPGHNGNREVLAPPSHE